MDNHCEVIVVAIGGNNLDGHRVMPVPIVSLGCIHLLTGIWLLSRWRRP